jgi:hypothetical protein
MPIDLEKGSLEWMMSVGFMLESPGDEARFGKWSSTLTQKFQTSAGLFGKSLQIVNIKKFL